MTSAHRPDRAPAGETVGPLASSGRRDGRQTRNRSVRVAVDGQRIAIGAFVVGFMAMTAGATLWVTADGPDGSTPGTLRHVWERGLLMGAIVLTATGLWLLARHLVGTAGFRLVLLGAAVYTGAGTLGLIHEAGTLSTTLAAPLWGLPAYVAGVYLGQAAIGLGFVRSGFEGVGWLVLAWNLAWLVILPLASSGDLYYPVLHHLLQPALIVPLLRDG